jgi:hypothetical protein
MRRIAVICVAAAMMLLFFAAPAMAGCDPECAGGPPVDAGVWVYNPHLVSTLPTPLPEPAEAVNPHLVGTLPTPLPLPLNAVIHNPNIVGGLPLPIP